MLLESHLNLVVVMFGKRMKRQFNEWGYREVTSSGIVYDGFDLPEKVGNLDQCIGSGLHGDDFVMHEIEVRVGVMMVELGGRVTSEVAVDVVGLLFKDRESYDRWDRRNRDRERGRWYWDRMDDVRRWRRGEGEL